MFILFAEALLHASPTGRCYALAGRVEWGNMKNGKLTVWRYASTRVLRMGTSKCERVVWKSVRLRLPAYMRNFHSYNVFLIEFEITHHNLKLKKVDIPVGKADLQ